MTHINSKKLSYCLSVDVQCTS